MPTALSAVLSVALFTSLLAGCKSPTSPASTGAGSASPAAPAGSAASAAPIANPLPPSEPAAPAAPPRVRPAHVGVPLLRDAKRAPRCGKLAGPLAASLPMLADRLRISAPAAAVSSPRPWDVMGAPAAEASETRLMIGGGASGGKSGEAAMAIVAKELWQLDPDAAPLEPGAIHTPKSFADEAPKFLAAAFGDATVEAVTLADPQLHAWAARPKKVELAGGDAAPVLALLLSLPDGTLQTLSFHISPALISQAAGCTALAEQIASSLTLGPRRLDRSPGVRELAGAGAGRRLSLTVPADYVLVHQRAEDFDHHRIYKLRPLGLYPGDLLVAIDAHPDRALPPDATDTLPGTLLGEPVTWQGQRTPGGGYLVANRPLPETPLRSLQVVLRATREPAYLDEFRKVAETLELKVP